MKKQILTVLLMFCMVLTMQPMTVLAGESTVPSVDVGRKIIYANGAYLKLEDGETSNHTKVSYKLAEGAPWTVLSECDNKDLSCYTIFGGVARGPFEGDSNITIEGGYVGDVMGGNYEEFGENLTGNVTIVMTGGSVERILACGLWNAVGGDGKIASITITGGTVRGGENGDIELNARITSGTAKKLTITGGTINGTIASTVTPTNVADPVYKTTLTLKGYDDSTVKDTAVSGLTLSSGSYGMKDVTTDANGKLYVYLPKDTKVTGATTADGKSYTNSEGITVLEDGLASGDLKKTTPDAPNCIFSFDGENAGKLIDATTDMEYSLDGGTSYKDCTTDMVLTVTNITENNDIKIRIKTPAGDVQTIDITKPAAPTAPTAMDCTTSDNNDGKLQGITTAMEYQKKGAASWTACTGTDITGLVNSTYYVRLKATDHALASDIKELIVKEFGAPVGGSTGGGGGGGLFIPPTDKAVDDCNALIKAIGTVTLDKADEIKAARTAYDKLSAEQKKNANETTLITAEKTLKTLEDLASKEEERQALMERIKDMDLVARSKMVTMKNGKKGIKVTWLEEKDGKVVNIADLDFDGIQIFRSNQRYQGYGKKPIFTTTKNAYYNTSIQAGETYFYKIRAFRVVDGVRLYTEYSSKAWRVVK